MQRAVFLNVCAAFLTWAAPADAAVMVAFGPEVYTSGANTGYVDLTISGDLFAAYNLQLTIAAADQSSSLANLGYELEFAPISTISTDTYNNGYVFGTGDSADYSGNLGNTTKDGAGYYTTLTTGDLTANFDDVQPGSTNDLLVRLDFQLPAGALQGKFDISVDPSITNFQNAAQEFGADYLTIAGTLSDTVTVGTAASPLNAVPEPGTFGMMFLGMTGLAWLKRRRA